MLIRRNERENLPLRSGEAPEAPTRRAAPARSRNGPSSGPWVDQSDADVVAASSPNSGAHCSHARAKV
jgi:hypothetical protein